jgi:hypothetical protein
MNAPVCLLLFIAAICDHSFFLAAALFLVGAFSAVTT